MSLPDRLTCEETFARLDDYLDRHLSAGEMLKVREHLELCEVCASEFRFERGVIEQVRSKLRRVEAPADLLSRISLALREEGGPRS